jgi:hypothetical protein
VSAINTSGSDNHFEGTLNVENGQLVIHIDGGATDFVLRSELGGPATINLIDDGSDVSLAPRIEGSPFVLGAGGVLRVIDNVPSGPGPQARGILDALARFEGGRVELVDSSELDVYAAAEFTGDTVFTQTTSILAGRALNAFPDADHLFHGSQIFDVYVEARQRNDLVLDDNVSVSFERGVTLDGAEIRNAAGLGGNTTTILKNFVQIDSFSSSLIATDFLDWDELEQLVVRAPLIIDSPNAGMNTTFSGLMGIQGDGSLTANFDLSWRLSGQLVLSGGATIGGQSFTVTSSGEIIGGGTVDTNVTNRGRIAPGSTFFGESLTFTGNLSLRDLSTVSVDIVNDLLGITHDQISVAGTLTLDGTLEITTFGDFPVGSSFDLLLAPSGLTGTFVNEVLPAVSGGHFWHVRYEPTLVSVVLLQTGDLDCDSDVDFDDIDDLILGLTDPAAYEALFGMSADVKGDTDGDGNLDFDDIAGFVEMLTATSGFQAVPEPPAAPWAWLGLFGLLRCWRRAR